MAKWVLQDKQANDLSRMAEVLNISESVAQVLVNRGINTRNKATSFLNPNYNDIKTFSQAKDVDLACEILYRNIKNGSRICIYGDYDVDGVSSTTIMLKGLKGLFSEIKLEYYIPDREKDGYGLSVKTAEILIEKGYDLVITCDNGISSIEEVKLLKSKGIEVIIIDHHEPPVVDGKEVVPCADAVIDPKQSDCEYGFREMCTGGLTYTFMKFFADKYGLSLENEKELNVFGMIASVCDIVPLTEDNRAIVKNGLELLNGSNDLNKGILKLLEKKSLLEKNISVYTIGFVIGPCINASGRLELASHAVELFTSDDTEVIEDLAEKLVVLNEERKDLTKKAVDNVISNIENSEIINDKVFVVLDEEIHESVAGIVAGRVKEKFYHPTIVLTRGHDCAKGSARSIVGYNIFEAMTEVKEYFRKFGGHSMAAGLSLDYDKIDDFRKAINQNCQLGVDDFEETIIVEKEIKMRDITFETARQIEVLEPFGAGNKEPLFLSRRLKVENLKISEEKNYVRATFKDDSSYQNIQGIGFGFADRFIEEVKEKFDEYTANKILNGVLRSVDLFVDLVYNIEVNEYRGNYSVQVQIKDFKLV